MRNQGREAEHDVKGGVCAVREGLVFKQRSNEGKE